MKILETILIFQLNKYGLTLIYHLHNKLELLGRVLRVERTRSFD
jgi:hypothetical protein